MTKKRIVVLCLIASLIIGGVLLVDSFFWKVVRIKGQSFIAELPRTSKDYERGLGGREKICQHCAMLFTFPQKGEYAFWMKDMRFNLDILWIADGKIVYIEKDFFASSSETVRPNVPADRVLEISAGMSARYNFKVGDKIAIF